MRLIEHVESMIINKKFIVAYSRQPEGKNLLRISMPTEVGVTKMELKNKLSIGLN
jgi:hypothetical protein